jgi:hypothetical protein
VQAWCHKENHNNNNTNNNNTNDNNNNNTNSNNNDIYSAINNPNDYNTCSYNNNNNNVNNNNNNCAPTSATNPDIPSEGACFMANSMIRGTLLKQGDHLIPRRERIAT